jgi:tetratricopeptide (TPR) repeat protein
MGEVFLAEDLSLDRKVALKFLLPGFLGGADGRLLREAKAAAHLDHPFICKVYEVGEHEGRPFIATEYVDGVTLKDRLATGRVPQEEARRMAAEVAEALHFAHARGVVHRDVKPANVMLGADGHVKVMDFGIAKRLDAPVSGDAHTVGVAPLGSVPGEMTGTPAYMSPEQLRGEPVDPRSDAFSFGVMMHECLTGSHPFMRGSIFETANAILTEPAPPLDQAVPGVSPLLAHVVARCLEKNRDRRYQSLSDVRIELENPSASMPALPAALSRKRPRWIMVPVMLAALLVVAGVVNKVRPLPFFATEPALAFKERDWIIVSDFNNLTGDKVFDRSLRVALEVAIAQSQYVNVYPPDRVAGALQRMGRPPAARLDEALAAEVAERENVRGLLACGIAQVGNTYSLTARLIRPQTRVVVRTESVTATNKDGVLGALDELARRVRGSLGESLAALADQSRPLPQVTTSSLDALKLYSDAFAAVPSERNSTDQLLLEAIKLDPHFALAHAELGRRFYLASHHDVREEGEKHFKQALSSTDRLTVRERLWIQAVAEDSRRNRDRAVRAYETYLGQYPDDARALFRVSWTRMAAMGDFDKAIEGFKRVLTLQPSDSSAWVNLASAYAGKGDYENAVPSYQKAFALQPALILAVFINHEYGFTLVETGKIAEAEAVFNRMTKEADPPTLRARGFRSLALLDMHRGRYLAAAERLRQAIAINQTYDQGVSEYRDRLYLVTALEALGRSRDTDAEWITVDRRIAKLSLSPDWLARPIKMKARRGDIAGAKRLMQSLVKTTGRATADASVARNTDLDRAWADLAQAEIDLAERRTEHAITLLEHVHVILKSPHSMESLANAYVAAGRLPDAVARYEEIVGTPRLGDEAQELWQRSHVALARLYERVGRPADARRVYSALAGRWKEGDEELVLLKTARDQIARLSARSGN